MKYLLITILLLISNTAWAVCPASSNLSFTATASGGFRLCPPELDADGDGVAPDFYSSCTVTVTYGTSKTAVVTLPTPVPGVLIAVGFPAAKGQAKGYGFCTNLDGAIGGTEMVDIRFRRGTPANPKLVP